MPGCAHSACKECFEDHFTNVIRLLCALMNSVPVVDSHLNKARYILPSAPCCNLHDMGLPLRFVRRLPPVPNVDYMPTIPGTASGT